MPWEIMVHTVRELPTPAAFHVVDFKLKNGFTSNPYNVLDMLGRVHHAGARASVYSRSCCPCRAIPTRAGRGDLYPCTRSSGEVRWTFCNTWGGCSHDLKESLEKLRRSHGYVLGNIAFLVHRTLVEDLPFFF